MESSSVGALDGLELAASNQPSTAGFPDTTHAGRLTATLAELESGSKPAIVSLTVIDPPDTLPRCWINVFDTSNAIRHIVPSELIFNLLTNVTHHHTIGHDCGFAPFYPTSAHSASSG